MTVRPTRVGRVAVVTIDRPDARNAVDRPTADALTEALRAADVDAGVSAIVLTGAGGTFCAGADLKAVASGDVARMNRLQPDGDAPMGPSRLELTKPVIAAIAGHAVAGGLELACWCDLRIVEESAILGVFCRRWGVPLIDGGTARLPRIVGLGRATDLILTGRAVTAAEALSMGLATRVVPDGSALDEAIALGEQLAAFPRGALRADLQSARRAFDGPLPDVLRAELERGLASVVEGAAGAARFAGGAGRGGRPA